MSDSYGKLSLPMISSPGYELFCWCVRRNAHVSQESGDVMSHRPIDRLLMYVHVVAPYRGRWYFWFVIVQSDGRASRLFPAWRPSTKQKLIQIKKSIERTTSVNNYVSDVARLFWCRFSQLCPTSSSSKSSHEFAGLP